MDPLARLRELTARVAGPRAPVVATGFEPLDQALPGGGLARGCLHEFVGPDDAVAPLWWLCALAGRAFASGLGGVVWIGRRVWPCPSALGLASPGVLGASLLVDAQGPQRAIAIELALRAGEHAAGGGGGHVVVADGAGLTLAQTRRLQLAAEASADGHEGAGAPLCLLARPWRERGELSCAATRWGVKRWGVERCSGAGAGVSALGLSLLRCKGVGVGVGVGGPWVLEYDHASITSSKHQRSSGAVRVRALVADRPADAALAGVA